MGNLTWVSLAYHDTGCSPEGYIVYSLKYIKLDMQSSRFPVKLFSITCGECHEYEGSPLICLERCGCLHCNGDFQNHVTCVTSGLPSWSHGVVMDNIEHHSLWLLKRKKLGQYAPPPPPPLATLEVGMDSYISCCVPPSPLPPLKKRGKGEGREGYHLMDR